MGATFPFYRGITIKYDDSLMSEKRLEAVMMMVRRRRRMWRRRISDQFPQPELEASPHSPRLRWRWPLQEQPPGKNICICIFVYLYLCMWRYPFKERPPGKMTFKISNSQNDRLTWVPWSSRIRLTNHIIHQFQNVNDNEVFFIQILNFPHHPHL